jgi:hypothetical protein
MNHSRRQEILENTNSLGKLVVKACDCSDNVSPAQMESKISNLERFFEDNGFSRGQPYKMAVLYTMMRHGHSIRSVEKWWGVVDSNYYSYSPTTGEKYLNKIRDLINDKVLDNPEDISDTAWTPGDRIYDPRNDPLREHFDYFNNATTENSSLTSFAD